MPSGWVFAAIGCRHAAVRRRRCRSRKPQRHSREQL